MTKQSVMVSEPHTEAGINNMMEIVAKSSSLFSSMEMNTDNGYSFPIKKQFLKKLETSCVVGAEKGTTRINAWVDAMRASSPPRLNTEMDNNDQSSWMMQHPSALNMFDEIINASKGKQIVMFLDYDGTLSPIVADPERAFMPESIRTAVRDAARYFPTAIVSGRSRDKVFNFVQLAELYYAGSHGMDIKGPTKGHKNNKTNKPVLFQPASAFLPLIDEVTKTLIEKVQSTPGAFVENNKFCVSVHFRCVEEERWDALAEQVRSVVEEYPELRMSQGRKVFEIRPDIKWDKGKALEFLLESLGYANSTNVFPVYIGDDLTDEDAFKVLRERGQGLGILVSKFPKNTNASYSLREPAEVKDFLCRLVEWKRYSRRMISRV